MGNRTLGLRPSRAGRCAVLESAPACAPEVAARVLGALLLRPVAADEVVARAVGLGLLRQPLPDRAVLLSAQALSRLFLAGYRLPAHVESGTLRLLRHHLEAGRQLFVVLRESAGGAGELLQVRGSAGDLGLLVGPPGPGPAPTRLLAPEALARAWAPSGDLLVAALRGWEELPAEGRSFFGGGRDLDGTYHWDTAECATDAAGRVLRC